MFDQRKVTEETIEDSFTTLLIFKHLRFLLCFTPTEPGETVLHTFPSEDKYFLLLVFPRQNFTKAGEQEAVRCDTVAQLQKRGCSVDEIISPENYKEVVQEDPLSASSDNKEPVQMSPQEIHLNVRPGQWNQLNLFFILQETERRLTLLPDVSHL